MFLFRFGEQEWSLFTGVLTEDFQRLIANNYDNQLTVRYNNDSFVSRPPSARVVLNTLTYHYDQSCRFMVASRSDPYGMGSYPLVFMVVNSETHWYVATRDNVPHLYLPDTDTFHIVTLLNKTMTDRLPSNTSKLDDFTCHCQTKQAVYSLVGLMLRKQVKRPKINRVSIHASNLKHGWIVRFKSYKPLRFTAEEEEIIQQKVVKYSYVLNSRFNSDVKDGWITYYLPSGQVLSGMSNTLYDIAGTINERRREDV